MKRGWGTTAYSTIYTFRSKVRHRLMNKWMANVVAKVSVNCLQKQKHNIPI